MSFSTEKPPLAHRIWRCLPQRARRHVLAAACRAIAPRPDTRPPPTGPGVAVGGEFSRICGLTRAANLTVAGLRALGLVPRTIDVSWRSPGLGGEKLPDRTPLILHVNAPDMPLALARLGRGTARGRRIVGAWAWELPDLPRTWISNAAYAHEAWTPSRFAATALEKALPGRVRVVTPPLAVAPPMPARLGRDAFGLPEDAIVVLTAFDLASSFARKNPLAAIAAFRAAFGARTDRILLLKIVNPGHFPADFARIAAEVAGAGNIRLFTATLPDADNFALTACADIVLSLHRSEGFGLILAEAMLLGIPVIATAWSGNMDFMDPASAALVRARLVPAIDPRGTYDLPVSHWAHPDLAEATAALVGLAGDPIARRELGARGRRHATACLGPESLAAAMRALSAD